MLKRANKKGLSEIIGYVLLISFAVIMGVIVYNWMSSYIMTEKDACPDDVSLVVKSYKYDCDAGKLEIEFMNKGLFNISAFKIRGSIDATKEIATIELPAIDSSKKEIPYHIFQKPLSPSGEAQTRVIEYHGGIRLRFVEITPYVFEKGKSLICTNSKIKQDLTCYVPGSEICRDSDADLANPNGINFLVKGTVRLHGDIAATDKCIGDMLEEYYCDGPNLNQMSVTCQSGQTCRKGACV